MVIHANSLSRLSYLHFCTYFDFEVVLNGNTFFALVNDFTSLDRKRAL